VKYMLLLNRTGDALPEPGTPELDQLIQEYAAAVALLYGELIRYEPTPVVEANRAVAVAMSEGPAAGLVILDALAHHRRLRRWAQLHIARAELLRRLGRDQEAADAYRAALDLEPAPATRSFIARRIRDITRAPEADGGVTGA
jgi:RNA polymerase sigma-70 factor, ECF subfamily